MNKKDIEKKPSGTDKKNENEEVVKRGKEAINAKKQIEKKPAEVNEKEAKEDAEKWRNEG